MLKKKRNRRLPIIEARRLPPLYESPIDELARDMGIVVQAVNRRLAAMRAEVIEAATSEATTDDASTTDSGD